MKKQDFKVLKTKDLYPFPDNPFHVAEDETLSELAESIKEFGIVTPIITRPKEDGNGYEVIAGQRRVRASELAGMAMLCVPHTALKRGTYSMPSLPTSTALRIWRSMMKRRSEP